MNIALPLIRQAFTGGVEKFQNDLARFLAEAGHQVTVLARTAEGSPHPAVQVRTHRSWAPGPALRLWAFNRWLQQELATGGYQVVYALGRTTGHDCIRLGGGSHATYLERMGLRLRPWSVGHRFMLAQERRGLCQPRCRRVVANAQMVADDVIRRYGLDPARVTVIRNGVDPARFHPGLRVGPGRALRQECGFRPEDPVLLFLGHGFARKGLDLVLAALTQVRTRHPALRLLVVGGDSHLADWRTRAAGFGPSVVFLGPRRDAPVCFAAADLFILPTRYDPFANATLEALACGLPVITTTGNGGHEVLTPGTDGSVVDLEPAALAAAVAYWLEPGRLAAGQTAAVATAGRNRIADRLADTLRMLEEVAARPRSPT